MGNLKESDTNACKFNIQYIIRRNYYYTTVICYLSSLTDSFDIFLPLRFDLLGLDPNKS